jgi:predicted ATPase/class 3 adenylate cyclase
VSAGKLALTHQFAVAASDAGAHHGLVAEELPTGTVTFLFTDIEGSTKLLQELGADAYAAALAEHRRILRDAFADHAGVEVDTQGDAFFAAFASARNAVASAKDAQTQLSATPIRVRMGLHSGEALVDDDRYVGLDVHRTARVAAAGHGGQILVSPTTAPLVESEPLRDLGEHRLKDLSAPLRIYQLGDDEFPPLKTLHRTNLPVPATAFLGRQRELESLLALARDSHRLLTLTGPGGTGKTRLALQTAAELAEEFPGGVFWVPLASLRDPSLIGSAVAQAIGAEEKSATDITESIAATVTAPTLLLVDNCEHLLDGVASLLSPLLATTEKLRVLATSREPLALAGERVVLIDPLERSDAVELFITRAEAAGASDLDRETASELCAQLDDLPLAIELAAARTAAFPVELLLERLSNRLEFLRGPRDVEERQRTLRATIAWSYDLLTPREQQLLRRTSIFVGGATIERLEDVAQADLEDVASLVAKSLVRMTPNPSGPRYWMLETIREFAAGQLDDAELRPLRRRYAEQFAHFARDASPRLTGPQAVKSLERLDAEVGNLRAAFSFASPGDDDAAVALGTMLGQLHILRGRYGEAHETLSETLERARGPLESAEVHRLLGSLFLRRNDLTSAETSFVASEECLGTPTEGDADRWRQWIALKLSHASLYYWRADTSALQAAVEELRPHIEHHGTAWQRAQLVGVQVLEGIRSDGYLASARTEELAREYQSAADAAGDWDGEFQLAFVLLWRGKADEARTHFRLGREQARAAGDVLIEIRCLVYQAIANRKLGDLDAVRALDDELAQLDDPLGYGGLIAANRAWLAWRDGDYDSTEKWGTAAIADWDRAGPLGPTIFQWSARFPLLAVDVARDRIDSAMGQATFMLDERQQALPDDVHEALTKAVQTGTREAFVHAVEVARRLGYT